MDQKIIETANEYRKMADMILESAEEAKFDPGAGVYIEDMLMRLYYIKSLELKLEKLQELLDEGTDAEIFEHVMAAEDTIAKTADTVFEAIEDYAAEEKDFRDTVEQMSANPETDDLGDLLRQLYKCEGILRMGYRTSRHIPIYGAGHGLEKLEGIERDTPEAPEDVIYRETGIDMYALVEMREKLIDAIGKKQNGEAQ